MLGSKSKTIEDLTAELAKTSTDLELSDKAKLDLENDIEAKSALIEKAEKETAELNAKLETVEAELKEEKDTFEARSDAKALAILAEHGTSPAPAPDPEVGKLNVLEQYQAMEAGSERLEFMLANEAEITKLMADAS